MCPDQNTDTRGCRNLSLHFLFTFPVAAKVSQDIMTSSKKNQLPGGNPNTQETEAGDRVRLDSAQED